MGGKIYGSITEWRNSIGKTQIELGVDLDRSQRMISVYERGMEPIPPDIVTRLREMGYNGPCTTQKPVFPTPLNVGNLLDEAENIIQVLEQRGMKPPNGALRREFQKLVVEELQLAMAMGGQIETLADRVERWWNLAQASKKK